MALKVSFQIFYSKLLLNRFPRPRNGFCLDGNKFWKLGLKSSFYLSCQNVNQLPTPQTPKSIICNRIHRCSGDTRVIKRKWQIIFSWASCSTDVILGKALLSSKTQLANQLTRSTSLPPGPNCHPPPSVSVSGMSGESRLPNQPAWGSVAFHQPWPTGGLFWFNQGLAITTRSKAPHPAPTYSSLSPAILSYLRSWAQHRLSRG